MHRWCKTWHVPPWAYFTFCCDIRFEVTCHSNTQSCLLTLKHVHVFHLNPKMTGGVTLFKCAGVAVTLRHRWATFQSLSFVWTLHLESKSVKLCIKYSVEQSRTISSSLGHFPSPSMQHWLTIMLDSSTSHSYGWYNGLFCAIVVTAKKFKHLKSSCYSSFSLLQLLML